MRAVVHDRYGPPELLRVDEVERPVPGEDEVLARVHAATVTRTDVMRMRSVEYAFAPLATGIRRPRKTSAGTDSPAAWRGRPGSDRVPRRRRGVRCRIRRDRAYALDEIVEAARHVETGQKTGNVVLRVSD